MIRQYQIAICDQCYLLVGDECNNPECVFCWRSMAEVAHILDVTLIRPIVDGESLDLHPARRSVVRPTYPDGRTDSEDPE
ncbi:MAG: hypothetical protein JW730_18380 [Anaerolineales bacterium]|nr:hypothetical protein [Anaerolineales bacterium]